MLEYAAYASETTIEISGSISNGAPRITGLADGKYVVTWTSDDPSDYGVYANIYTADGVALGSRFRVNENTMGSQGGPDVVALKGGGFVIAWTDNMNFADEDGVAITGQVYSAAGVKEGDQFVLNATGLGPQFSVSLDALENGGFVATWTDGSGGPDPDTVTVRAQQFDAAGARVGPEVLAPQLDRGDQYAQDVAGLANGDFVVVWMDNGSKPGDTSEFGVVARMFNAAGQPITGEFVVNTWGYLYQAGAQVSALEGGGFVVTWYDESGDGGDDQPLSIKAQIFAGDGARVGGEFLVNTTTEITQAYPAVTALPGGGFAITWQDFSVVDLENPFSYDSAVRLQVFDAAGAKVGPEMQVNTTEGANQGFPAITTLANGDIVVAWADPTGDEGAAWLRGQTFRLQPIDPGTNDILTGTRNGDELSGRGGDDLLSGSLGDDLLYGGDGDDILKGGAGNDLLAGGLGVDTADYSDLRDSGVRVSLADARYGGGGGSESAGYDQLNSIENLVGSRVDDELYGDGHDNRIKGQTGDDFIFGDAGDDQLFGDGGNDVLDGGEGYDVLAGGQGIDTFVFATLDGDLIKDWQKGEKIDFSAAAPGGHLLLETRYGRTYAGIDNDNDGQFDFGFIIVLSTTITASDFVF